MVANPKYMASVQCWITFGVLTGGLLGSHLPAIVLVMVLLIILLMVLKSKSRLGLRTERTGKAIYP